MPATLLDPRVGILTPSSAGSCRAVESVGVCIAHSHSNVYSYRHLDAHIYAYAYIYAYAHFYPYASSIGLSW